MSAATQKFSYDPSRSPSANPLPTKCGDVRRDRAADQPMDATQQFANSLTVCYKSTLAPLFEIPGPPPNRKRNHLTIELPNYMLQLSPTPASTEGGFSSLMFLSGWVYSLHKLASGEL
jgi:hypothetical protein